MANKHRKVWKVVSRKPLSEKQTQLKGKTLSWKPNQIFLLRESVFRWPESVFRWPTFLMKNKHRKVWKVVFLKMNSGKQTWPKRMWLKYYSHTQKTLLIIIVFFLFFNFTLQQPNLFIYLIFFSILSFNIRLFWELCFIIFVLIFFLCWVMYWSHGFNFLCSSISTFNIRYIGGGALFFLIFLWIYLDVITQVTSLTS